MSKPSAASKEALDALHAAVAEELAKRIASGEATAADLNVARQFLKDNHVEAVKTPDNPLGKLAGALPFADEAGVTGEDKDYYH